MSRCYVIAEIGLSHMGDARAACRAVQAFADAGADAAKFQDHRGQLVPDGQAHPSPHVKMSRAAWYAMTSFTDEQWQMVRAACREYGVDYICSPFSVEALRRQVALEPRYIKIASGEVTNKRLLRELSDSKVQGIIISCGMAKLEEYQRAKGILEAGDHMCPIQWGLCRSEYPCLPEHSQLEEVEENATISDHTAGTWFPIAAVALGASMIEKHVHLDASIPHSDSDIAVTPDKFREMVDGIRAVEKALYEPSEPDLTEIRKVYLHAP